MKIYIANFNGVLDGLVKHFEKDLTRDWHEADVLVLWQDVIGDLENLASQAKNAGKRVIVAEHGLLSINDYIPPLNRPLVADTFMAWGNWTKEWLVNKAHVDPDRIRVTGTLISDKMIPRRKNHGPRILFAPRHWDGELQENLDVAEKLKECKYDVFSKLLDGENSPQNYPQPMSTNRQELNHIETCFQVLSWADVVVGIGEGTFGGLTHLMDIPYISVDHWQDKDLLGKTYTREEFKSQISRAAIQVPIESLLTQIDLCVKDPDINKEEREWFRKECLNYPGDPLKDMISVINEEL
jgi:hypothetical protein